MLMVLFGHPGYKIFSYLSPKEWKNLFATCPAGACSNLRWQYIQKMTVSNTFGMCSIKELSIQFKNSVCRVATKHRTCKFRESIVYPTEYSASRLEILELEIQDILTSYVKNDFPNAIEVGCYLESSSEICSVTERDIDPVILQRYAEKLSHITHLSLSCYGDGSLLSKFVNLKYLELEGLEKKVWVELIPNSLETLETLMIQSSYNLPNETDWKLFTTLKNLETLCILNSSITTIDGIENLSKLKHLTISFGEYLLDDQGWKLVMQLKNLENLNIGPCNLHSLQGIDGLQNLSTLRISNEFPTKLDFSGVQSLCKLNDFDYFCRVDEEYCLELKDLKRGYWKAHGPN